MLLASSEAALILKRHLGDDDVHELPLKGVRYWASCICKSL